VAPKLQDQGPSTSDPDREVALQHQVMTLSLGVAVVMLIGKLGAWSLTGSSAIFSDADETARVVAVLEQAISHQRIEGHHHVRHRRVNDQIWLEQHLLMPDDLTLVDAHDRAPVIEAEQRALFPKSQVQITSHLEPVTHDHADGVPHDAIVDAASTEEPDTS
jgi:divalent metal cation (Fe/Co/Zn/Cd) transporter